MYPDLGSSAQAPGRGSPKILSAVPDHALIVTELDLSSSIIQSLAESMAESLSSSPNSKFMHVFSLSNVAF
jgi:hypothetical protein